VFEKTFSIVNGQIQSRRIFFSCILALSSPCSRESGGLYFVALFVGVVMPCHLAVVVRSIVSASAIFSWCFQPLTCVCHTGPGGGGLEGLPDFFRGAPADDLGGALEDEDDLDALTFGDGFDVPLDGLPDFFQQSAPPAPSDAALSELDDLGGITGLSSGGELLSFCDC
jgi:hypothetical protein